LSLSTDVRVWDKAKMLVVSFFQTARIAGLDAKIHPTSPFMRTNRPYAIIVVLVFLFALSIFARWHLIWERPLNGYRDNEDATAHVLATDIAYEQTSSTVHHFLPIFTLGASSDHFIDDLPSASRQDRLGNFYYTSFPPLLFLTPYVFEKATGSPPSPAWLRWFNITVQLIVAILIGLLCHRCLQETTPNDSTRYLAAACAAIVYLSAPECLKSHCISFWAQQLYAPLLIIQLGLFIYRPSFIALFILAFLTGMLEWSAYLANAGMALLAFLSFWRTRDRRALYLGICLSIATLLALVTLFRWYSLVASPTEYLAALRYRSGVRSGRLYQIFKLIPGYLQSFGLFAVVIVAAFYVRSKSGKSIGKYRVKENSRIIFPQLNPFYIIFIVLGFAMTENLLLAGHATDYTYDRLKGVQLLAFALGWAVSFDQATTVRFLKYSCVAGVLSCGLFWIVYEGFENFQSSNYQWQHRLGEVIRKTAVADSPAFANISIRGTEIYYSGRNIQELAATDNLDVGAFIRQWCRQHHYEQATYYQVMADTTAVKVSLFSSGQPVVDLGTFSLGQVQSRPPIISILRRVVSGTSDASLRLRSRY
jgi:hypothetical protein